MVSRHFQESFARVSSLCIRVDVVSNFDLDFLQRDQCLDFSLKHMALCIFNLQSAFIAFEVFNLCLLS